MVSYDYEELNKSESESVWCKLKVENNSSITIGVCYRSQVASEQELHELFKVIGAASQGTVLIISAVTVSGLPTSVGFGRFFS